MINPSTGEVIAQAPVSSAEDVDRAVEAARKAFETWGSSTPRSRSEALLELADAILEHGDEFADIESADAGKPRQAFVDEELEMCADNLRFFAGAARNMEGKAANEYVEGFTSMTRREPVGVAAQITPVELPADDGDVEDRPGVRRRLHQRAEAGREHAALDLQAGRDRRRHPAARASST